VFEALICRVTTVCMLFWARRGGSVARRERNAEDEDSELNSGLRVAEAATVGRYGQGTQMLLHSGRVRRVAMDTLSRGRDWPARAAVLLCCCDKKRF